MKLSTSAVIATLFCLLPIKAQTAPDFDTVEIETIAVAAGIYMLRGAGGNIGVSIGQDGVVLIDDQYAPLTEKISAAIAKLSDAPVRFVINTHWHGDHTGGNESFRTAGAIIVAHENVRTRMSTEQFIKAFGKPTPPSAPGALPVVTFTESVTLHVNGLDLRALHVAAAHTDGDSVVYLRDADVIHMGDTFFNRMYPFIDIWSGGSLEGTIAAVNAVLAVATEHTKIIPGHGPLGDRGQLEAYRDMLVTVRDRIAKAIIDGKSEDDVIESAPIADLDGVWGGGPFKADLFVRICYRSLAQQ